MEKPLFSLKNIDSSKDQALKQHVVENIPENRLISLSGSQDARLHASLNCFPNGSIKFDHGVVIRLHNLNLFLGLFHHFKNRLFNLISFGYWIVM
jgi:hypothetical protein